MVILKALGKHTRFGLYSIGETMTLTRPSVSGTPKASNAAGVRSMTTPRALAAFPGPKSVCVTIMLDFVFGQYTFHFGKIFDFHAFVGLAGIAQVIEVGTNVFPDAVIPVGGFPGIALSAVYQVA